MINYRFLNANIQTILRDEITTYNSLQQDKPILTNSLHPNFFQDSDCSYKLLQITNEHKSVYKTSSKNCNKFRKTYRNHQNNHMSLHLIHPHKPTKPVLNPISTRSFYEHPFTVIWYAPHPSIHQPITTSKNHRRMASTFFIDSWVKW